jgi:hypothetical protein
MFGTSVDIFVGSFPPLKFDVNNDSVVEFGVGDLIASNDVPKVVGRVDTSSVQAVLKICSARNYQPANFFEIRSKLWHNCGMRVWGVIYKTS